MNARKLSIAMSVSVIGVMLVSACGAAPAATPRPGRRMYPGALWLPNPHNPRPRPRRPPLIKVPAIQPRRSRIRRMPRPIRPIA